MFITVFTTSRHLSVSKTRSFSSTFFQPVFLYSFQHHPPIYEQFFQLPSGIFFSGFPTKTLHAPLLSRMFATCPNHFILLDFIIWIEFGKKNRSWSSTQCNFLQFPATSSLSGLKIIPSTLCFRKSAAYVSPSTWKIKIYVKSVKINKRGNLRIT